MQHAQKVVIVPIEQYQPSMVQVDMSKLPSSNSSQTPANFQSQHLQQPALTQLQRLDDDMKQILLSTNMEEREKSNLYQEALRRYLLLQKQERDKPIPVKISNSNHNDEDENELLNLLTPYTTTPISTDATEQRRRQRLSIENTALKDIPRSYRGDVLDFISQHSIKYNADGQLIHKNRPIPQSNVCLLALGKVTRSKSYKTKVQTLPGYKEFKQMIQTPLPRPWEQY